MTSTAITWQSLRAAGVDTTRIVSPYDTTGQWGMLNADEAWVAYDADNHDDAAERIVFGPLPDEDGHYPDEDGHYPDSELTTVWGWTLQERRADDDFWDEIASDLDSTFERMLARVAELTNS